MLFRSARAADIPITIVACNISLGLLGYTWKDLQLNRPVLNVLNAHIILWEDFLEMNDMVIGSLSFIIIIIFIISRLFAFI